MEIKVNMAMKSLGIVIKKNEVFYTIIEGDNADSSEIKDVGKEIFNCESTTLMSDFNCIFIQLLSKYSPDIVSYKLSHDVKLNNISYLHYSIGVLKLLCEKRAIQIIERSSQWITAKHKFKISNFQNAFPNCSYKNDQLLSAVVAWYGIG